MSPVSLCECDGCGQPASLEHFANRLKRLQSATRFRPVHIQVLFLGAASPAADADYLYTEAGDSLNPSSSSCAGGEAARLLSAVGLSTVSATDASARGAILSEFQHRGFYLTHILECPADAGSVSGATLLDLCERQLPSLLTRIRRSLRPKRIAIISRALELFLPRLLAGALGAPLLLDLGRPFGVEDANPASAIEKLRLALG